MSWDDGKSEWTIEIKHDGMWPYRWTWKVCRTDYPSYNYDIRRGSARTQDAARRHAVKARASIEREDIVLHDTGS